MQTYEIQNAINEAERVIDPLSGRGKRVEIYQHELAVLGISWRIEATSYGRSAPSGLGAFTSRDDAEKAMIRLGKHLDEQRGKKEASKAKVRKMGAD